MELTIDQISAITDVPKEEINGWVEQGCPLKARPFYLWYRDNIVSQPVDEVEGSDEELDIAGYKLKFELARSKKYQLRTEKLVKKYTTISSTKACLNELVYTLCGILDNIPADISKRTLDKREPDILIEIDRYIRKVLLKASKG